MRRITARLRRLSLGMAVGWGLAGLGGATMAATTAGFDPETASATTRTVVTVAFGVAQFGLAVVAGTVLVRLYRLAAGLGNGRRRRG